MKPACWQELEAICEAGKDKNDVKEVNLPRAGHILEALARIGGPRVRSRESSRSSPRRSLISRITR